MLRVDPGPPGQRDHVLADRGVAQVLPDPVARLQRDVAVEQDVRGRRVDRQHGQLGGVGVVVHDDRVPGRDDDPVGPGALLVGGQDDHPSPDQALVRVRAGLEYPPDPLGAERHGRLRLDPVPARGEQEVGRVHGRRLDRDQQVVGAQGQVGIGLEADGIIDVADCGQNNLAHDEISFGLNSDGY
jgi:hypothetical protein